MSITLKAKYQFNVLLIYFILLVPSVCTVLYEAGSSDCKKKRLGCAKSSPIAPKVTEIRRPCLCLCGHVKGFLSVWQGETVLQGAAAHRAVTNTGTVSPVSSYKSGVIATGGL